MKKQVIMFLFAAGAYCFQSCDSNTNRSADDSVEYATEQNENARQGQGATSMNAGEDAGVDFAVKAADAGLTEVSAGKIAQDKAQDQRVKDFAAMMIQDHRKANEELKAIAANKNITLPTAPGESHQKQIADLNSNTGAEFDQEFMDMMVDNHQKTIDLFEDAAEDVKDPELRAFATKTLPSLKKHLQEAEKLEDAIDQ